jgi:hypothetical protein
MLDELKERNILKLILIVRFAHATLDVGHPIFSISLYQTNQDMIDIGLSLLSLTGDLLSSKISVCFVRC